MKYTIGTRAFPVAGPRVWNSPPAEQALHQHRRCRASAILPTTKNLSIPIIISSSRRLIICNLSVVFHEMQLWSSGVGKLIKEVMSMNGQLDIVEDCMRKVDDKMENMREALSSQVDKALTEVNISMNITD